MHRSCQSLQLFGGRQDHGSKEQIMHVFLFVFFVYIALAFMSY